MRTLIINGVMFEKQFNGNLTITHENRRQAERMLSPDNADRQRVIEKESPMTTLTETDVALLRHFLDDPR